MRFSGRRRAWVAWLAVVLFPIVLNLPELVGLVKADPLFRFSYLQSDVVPGPLDIHASFDPSIGIVFQPLGHRSAEELVHGKLPWWNALQGIGAPLAGGMSPGSFYPLIFLELLPNGQTVLDVVVQILAGICTFLLVLRLGLGRLAGVVAALLFEANGTFAWLNSGWCYPLPCLPLLIYGVELTLGAPLRDRICGTMLVAIAVCVSITGAMIEIAYLDGLLGVAWTILRVTQLRRSDIIDRILRLILGATIGLLLASPLLIAFGDFLSVAYAANHSGVAHPDILDIRPLPQMVLPYVLGPVFYNDSGYAGIALALVAVCGALGRRLRGIRSLLACWVVLAFGATIGLPSFHPLVDSIPGVKYIAYERYLDGSWEFALALLAAFFIADLAAKVERPWVRCAAATGIVVTTLAAGLAGMSDIVRDSFGRVDYAVWGWASVAWAIACVGALWVLAPSTASLRRRGAIVGAVLVLECSINYLIPTLGFPVRAKLNDGSVAFLRSHLGLQRSFTFGPLAEHYASFYGVAELDDIELPVAKTWSDYIQNKLDGQASEGLIDGQHPQAFETNIMAFEKTGVAYAFASAGTLPFSNFDEPVDPGVVARNVDLLEERTPVSVTVDGVPSGSLAEVALAQNNDGDTANGFLDVRACSAGRCVDGERRLSESPSHDAPFWIELDRPLFVRDGRISLAIRQRAATAAEGLWLFGPGPGASVEHVLVSGVPDANHVARVVLEYASLTTAAETVRLAADASNPNIARASFPLANDNGSYVNEIGVVGVDGRRTSVELCSAGRCETAVPHGRGPGGEVWFALRHQLYAEKSVVVSFEGASVSARPIVLRLNVGTERPTAVYHDALVDVWKMPHPAPYFSAPGCALDPEDREHVTVRCSQPSTLTRLELYLPGWTATIGASAAKVLPTQDVFQAVALPAGTSSVSFDFTPPYMQYGFAAFTLGFLAIGYQLAAFLSLRKRKPNAVAS